MIREVGTVVELIVTLKDPNGMIIGEYAFPAPPEMFSQNSSVVPTVTVSARMTEFLGQYAVKALSKEWSDNATRNR